MRSGSRVANDPKSAGLYRKWTVIVEVITTNGVWQNQTASGGTQRIHVVAEEQDGDGNTLYETGVGLKIDKRVCRTKGCQR